MPHPVDPEVGPEARALLDHLNAQREHILGIIDGLDDDTLRRPALPSGWTPLGLVQHLAVDVERFWFRAIFTGDQAVIDGFAATPGGAWQVDPHQPAAAVFATYRNEAALTNALIAATPLAAIPAWWPTHLFGDSATETLREVVLHVIVETATHAGHLDAARELTDGKQWLVLP
jgi:hypothetical protein